MFPTDPVSVQQFRRGDLIEAARFRNPWESRRSTGRSKSVTRMLRSIGRLVPVVPWRHSAVISIDAEHELFAGLGRRELTQLTRLFTLMDVDPGQSLGHQGEPRSEFVVVLEGRIGISIDGLPHAVFDTGSHFGALPMIDDGPDVYRRASFSVLEHSRIAIADRQAFVEILEQHPVVGQRIKAIADVRRAYFAGRADGKVMTVENITEPFPVHGADGLDAGASRFAV